MPTDHGDTGSAVPREPGPGAVTGDAAVGVVTTPPDASTPAEPPVDAATAVEEGPAPIPARTRRGMFELEGRAAPGLYLAAWSLAVAGLGAVFIAVAAGGGSGAGVAFVLGIALLGLGMTAGAGSQALQRRADGAPFPGPAPVLVFAAAFTLALVVVFVIGALGGLADDAAAVIASVLASAVVSLGLVALVVVSPGSLSWRDMGFRLPRPGEGSVLGDVAWGVTLAVPTLFGAAILAAALVAILGAAPESPLPPPRDGLGVVVSLIAAAVVAPIWEEAFFRGYATTAWERAAGARAAIVRGAVFFALVHVTTLVGTDFGTALRTALIAFAVRLPVGLVLGWVFLRRRTLVAPIALHATYNAIPVLLVALGAGLAPS